MQPQRPLGNFTTDKKLFTINNKTWWSCTYIKRTYSFSTRIVRKTSILANKNFSHFIRTWTAYRAVVCNLFGTVNDLENFQYITDHLNLLRFFLLLNFKINQENSLRYIDGIELDATNTHYKTATFHFRFFITIYTL